MKSGRHDYLGKRFVDVCVSVVALLLTSPVLVIIAALVKLTSHGPVLYRAQRVGRHGRPITVHKFRSMRIDAPGPKVTAADDPRITPIGRLLRGAKLDEFPQFWDVLIGSMSIVGPRPEDRAYVAEYSEVQERILDWRPGITSPASIAFRHEEDVLVEADDREAAYATISADKIALDLSYFEYATLRTDIGVIARTIRAVFDQTHRDPPRPTGSHRKM